MDIKNRTFVFTGSLGYLRRKDAESFIESKGGFIQKMVSTKTDYLVVGSHQLNLFEEDRLTRKRIIANKLVEQGIAIEIIWGEEFLNYYHNQMIL